MPTLHRNRREHFAAAAFGVALVVCPGFALTQPDPQEIALSVNDVSWLFPPPATAADLGHLIAINDLTVPDPAHPGSILPVWSDDEFANFLAIADSAAAQVSGGSKISLPVAVRTKTVWFVAGVRIDAGAPGLDPAIIAVYGQRPQIRLILQPVLVGPDGSVQVQDLTAHLIFDFTLQDTPANLQACFLHAVPDLAALRSITSEAAMLRDELAAGQFAGVKISTAGPLGVHPGLANAATAPLLAAQMKAFLLRHLSADRIHSMALMGLPNGAPAPWIFLSMLRMPTGQFAPVPGPALDGTQFAMELTPIGQSPRVAPTPHPNNLSPVTCASGAFGPTSSPIINRHGRSTSDVFASNSPDPADTRAVLDLIADPTRSHFFNTDCVSCHTETRRSMEVLQMQSSPGLSPSVMPDGPYNVRNFGWSPPIDGPVQGTATRRTAAETAAVVSWLNTNILNH